MKLKMPNMLCILGQMSHTCQLTLLDKFSTISRYSVLKGGPYRELFLEELELLFLCLMNCELDCRVLKNFKNLTCHHSGLRWSFLHHVHPSHLVCHCVDHCTDRRDALHFLVPFLWQALRPLYLR